MPLLPLVSHRSLDSLIAWRADGPVSLRQFLAEAGRLAARFPSGRHMLNMCSDRYRFSVGLAAAIISGRISLLPPTPTLETVRQIKLFAADVFCLADRDVATPGVPQLRYPENDVMNRVVEHATEHDGSGEDNIAVPQIPADQLIAVVFTSGSTGTPQPNPKTWGALVGSVRAGARRLGLSVESNCTLVGTVPPQHMYGFESTVLLAWQSGNALCHAQPFYPADICKALAIVPEPRMLVSSPVHLRALLDAGLRVPALAGVVSATAPLSAQLARAVEERCQAPLTEIYGSTETGQIASRRTAETEQWHLFPGVRLTVRGGRAIADGANVEAPADMGDIIEPISEELFLLRGRKADMVNIAGKRHSLAGLSHLLNSIPGVLDGAFFMPEITDAARVSRLAACVVAPGMEAPGLLAALRERIDPVFLPRPLVFVTALPRNATGKLPREALQALLDNRGRKNQHD